MTAEADVLAELRRLRARLPLMTGALAASRDGLVLAEELAPVEPEGIAALTAASLGVAMRITEATGQGGFKELLLRGEDGYVATYAAGSSAVLTVLTGDGINVGRLHLEARRAGARIGALVDEALRPEPPQPDPGTARHQPSEKGTTRRGLPRREAPEREEHEDRAEPEERTDREDHEGREEAEHVEVS